ncbi:MAG: peptidase M15 [Sterolibacterium sp.]|jgi:D-alanyl-D-alanine dipeptidase|nr:peptidase M15 [Sterolibacterium sp.]
MPSVSSGISPSLPVEDNGEPLVAIPPGLFLLTNPPPYQALGAPYGAASPWQLRQGVLHALTQAQQRLQQYRPGWRFKLFDAYRPLAVQAFMVWREFQSQAQATGDAIELARHPNLTHLRAHAPWLYERLAAHVFEFWSPPNDDPQQPPPHSTGAAVDLTLADATGATLDMGGLIDETSPRSYPAHYAQATNPAAREIHARRELLNAAMSEAGFCRHAHEWWHFSRGDLMWAQAQNQTTACYGRVA